MKVRVVLSKYGEDDKEYITKVKDIKMYTQTIEVFLCGGIDLASHKMSFSNEIFSTKGIHPDWDIKLIEVNGIVVSNYGQLVDALNIRITEVYYAIQ